MINAGDMPGDARYKNEECYFDAPTILPSSAPLSIVPVRCRCHQECTIKWKKLPHAKCLTNLLLLPEPPQKRSIGDEVDSCRDHRGEAVYRRANPAATPMAATTISLLQLAREAAPTNGEGDGTEVVKVPLALGDGMPEVAVPTWTWPSWI